MKIRTQIALNIGKFETGEIGVIIVMAHFRIEHGRIENFCVVRPLMIIIII